MTGQTPRGSLSNVLFRDGRQAPRLKFRPDTADLFALPSPEVVSQCLSKEYWAEAFPKDLTPIGSVFSDIGYDRKCDVCQTPEYKLGYKAMSPEIALLCINPKLNFQISPFSLSPIPGTTQGVKVRSSGLLRFEAPEIIGGFWVPGADTRHLTYEQVAAWQRRLLKIGSGVNKSQSMETAFHQ